MFCPICGIANPAHALTCITCRSNLDVFGQTGSHRDSPRCSSCGRSTPSLPVQRVAYCMHCGKPLRAALGTLPATPDPDLCPLCNQSGVRLKTLFPEATHERAKELAPPGKPVSVRILGAEGRAASAAGSASTGLVWILGGLAIVLLVLASRQVGSSQELLSAIQHGSSVEAVIAAHRAATTPYLLGALGALAAAFALLAIKVTVDLLREQLLSAYQNAWKNWNRAYYCSTDGIVYIRTVTESRWDPVEDLSHLIAQSDPNPLEGGGGG